MDRGWGLRKVKIWGPLFAYVGLIFYLSSQSQIGWATITPDYINHGVEYFGLSILMARALNDGLQRPMTARTLWLTLALCVVCGSADEVYQQFTPNRLSDIRDVVSDAIGATAGILSLLAARRLIRHRG